MAQGLELTGLAGTVALSVPLAALAVAVLLGTRARGRQADRGEPRPLPRAEPREAGERPVSMPRGEPRPEATAEALKVDAVAAARASAQRLASQIRAAESAGAGRDLAALLYEEARSLIAAKEPAAAADRLRKSLVLSARLGQKLEHARSRLELGDLAEADGDLTTACEHWSIARSLMHELARPADIRTVEARMRDHRCPTDWVLNDF